jgi:hypothetical protein
MSKITINPLSIPKIETQVLCADFLEAVLRFYENPENTAGFEKWLDERKGENANGQENGNKNPVRISKSRASTHSGSVSGCI